MIGAGDFYLRDGQQMIFELRGIGRADRAAKVQNRVQDRTLGAGHKPRRLRKFLRVTPTMQVNKKIGDHQEVEIHFRILWPPTNAGISICCRYEAVSTLHAIIAIGLV